MNNRDLNMSATFYNMTDAQQDTRIVAHAYANAYEGTKDAELFERAVEILQRWVVAGHQWEYTPKGGAFGEPTLKISPPLPDGYTSE